MGKREKRRKEGEGGGERAFLMQIEIRKKQFGWRWEAFCCCCSVAQLCPTLCHPPGSSVCGILQARILEWVAMPFSRGSSRPRDRTRISCIGRWILYRLTHLGSPMCLFMTGLFDFTKHPEGSSML